jgi:anti-sigma-K factor RskA
METVTVASVNSATDSLTLIRVTESHNAGKEPEVGQRGLSWRAMLVIVALAILVAAAIAYALIYPFFRQPPR